VIARIGGDEFAVLLPYAGASQAAAVTTDLRRVIRETSLDLGNGATLSLSASVAVAVINEETESDEAVLAEADHAMYADKRGEVSMTAATGRRGARAPEAVG
jgi:diguanylate cyclase (GGDEF)-like protein